MGCSYFYYIALEVVTRPDRSGAFVEHQMVPHEEVPDYDRNQFSTLQDYLDSLPLMEPRTVYDATRQIPWSSAKDEAEFGPYVTKHFQGVLKMIVSDGYVDRSIWKAMRREDEARKLKEE